MTDPPSYSAVRTLVGRLEAKGLVSHKTRDQSYVYRTVPQRAKVRDSALKQMVRTFFDGSAANAATALLGLTRSLKPEELEALQRAVDEAKERQQGAAS
jgi:predicted transcriptional regulator